MNIDGYDGDGFHCNWGWGGYQNDISLSALNGFNSGQGAIINIEPQSLAAPNLVMTQVIIMRLMEMVIQSSIREKLWALILLKILFHGKC